MDRVPSDQPCGRVRGRGLAHGLGAQEEVQECFDDQQRRRLAAARPADEDVSQWLRRLCRNPGFGRELLVLDPLMRHVALQPPRPVQECTSLLDVDRRFALHVDDAAAEQEGGSVEHGGVTDRGVQGAVVADRGLKRLAPRGRVCRLCFFVGFRAAHGMIGIMFLG